MNIIDPSLVIGVPPHLHRSLPGRTWSCQHPVLQSNPILSKLKFMHQPVVEGCQHIGIGWYNLDPVFVSNVPYRQRPSLIL